MQYLLIKWFINAAALFAVVHIFPHVRVNNWQTLLVAALVLGLLNAFLRPIIVLLTLPINLLSLGLFTLVINGLIFFLASRFVPGFTISSFWEAFWAALAFSIISAFLNMCLKHD